MQVLKPNFKRTIDGINGLAIVVVQNYISDEVLMVAFTDEAGWKQTLETGMVSLYSTSRKKSWVKGEESGNFMKVLDVGIDCDGDAIVYLVEPQGKKLACHTEAHTCFYRLLLHPDEAPTPPKAGPGEELDVVEAEVHPDLRE